MNTRLACVFLGPVEEEVQAHKPRNGLRLRKEGPARGPGRQRGAAEHWPAFSSLSLLMDLAPSHWQRERPRGAGGS